MFHAYYQCLINLFHKVFKKKQLGVVQTKKPSYICTRFGIGAVVTEERKGGFRSFFFLPLGDDAFGRIGPFWKFIDIL